MPLLNRFLPPEGYERDFKNSKLAVYRAHQAVSMDTVARDRTVVPVYAFMFELRVAGF